MIRAVCLAGLPDIEKGDLFVIPVLTTDRLPLTALIMALTRAEKAVQLQELKDKMGQSQSVVFAHYIGLTVRDVSELRRKLKNVKSEMKVAKKTLMQLATKETGLGEISEEALDGPVACIFSFADPLTGAQVAFAFAKDHPQVELIGGFFEGKTLSKEEAIAFAKIPGRQQLLTILASMLRTPLQNFASICSAPLQQFARSVDEIAKKKTVS